TNPDIPQWFCAIVEKLMAKNPAERFTSAKEVGSLLEQHLAHMQHPGQVPLPAPVQVPSSASGVKGAPSLRERVVCLIGAGALTLVSARCVVEIFINWAARGRPMVLGTIALLILSTFAAHRGLRRIPALAFSPSRKEIGDMVRRIRRRHRFLLHGLL